MPREKEKEREHERDKEREHERDKEKGGEREKKGESGRDGEGKREKKDIEQAREHRIHLHRVQLTPGGSDAITGSFYLV